MPTSPKRIYCIYRQLAEDAETVREFQVAKGERVSGTVTLLLSGDRAKLLRRWGDEIEELVGVLNGTHDDPYILEASQCWYWASLYAASAGLDWRELGMESLRQQAGRETTLADPNMIVTHAQRLVEQGDAAKPQKLFLIWWACDLCYRHSERIKDKWAVEDIMEFDLQEMKKRDYLQPILDLVEEDCCT